jgi:hypothetical protein
LLRQFLAFCNDPPNVRVVRVDDRFDKEGTTTMLVAYILAATGHPTAARKVNKFTVIATAAYGVGSWVALSDDPAAEKLRAYIKDGATKVNTVVIPAALRAAQGVVAAAGDLVSHADDALNRVTSQR